MNYIEPVRIVEYKDCDRPENMLIGNPCQKGFNGSKTMWLKRGGYIILDFGRELHGGISMATMGVVNGVGNLRIVFGESVMEAKSTIGEKNALNAHSMRDFVAQISSYSSAQPYGNTGFRFVKVEALDTDFDILTIKAYLVMRDLPRLGTFSSNDERLNHIWDTAVYTVQLNMQDYIWDGIKRDRDVWIGDMHPEVSTIRTVFGNVDVVKKSLDFVRDDTPEGQWMNGILTYSMWWIIIHYDLYMHYGDLAYLQQQKQCLTDTVNRIFEWIENGYDFGKSFMFLDWSSHEKPDEQDGIKAVVAIALESASKMFLYLGEKELSQKCMDCSQILKAEKIEIETNRRVSSILEWAGKESPNSKKWVADSSPYEMSCFMGYYVLLAKAKAGDFKGAVDVIRSYWGAMLDMGATTFWEDFDIEWCENAARIDEVTPEGKKDIHGDFGRYCYVGFRHSLCHGWASGPAAFLTETLAGIEILEPGCKKVKINPQLGGLEWYNITYPTPYGEISVKCRNKNGEAECEISAPAQIEIVR